MPIKVIFCFLILPYRTDGIVNQIGKQQQIPQAVDRGWTVKPILDLFRTIPLQYRFFILRMAVFLGLSLLILHEANPSDETLAECNVTEAPVGALSKSDYSAIVRLSDFRTPKNHKVLLIVLASGEEPDEVLANMCTQRKFIARLIRRLNVLNAAVIAFDKYYQTSSCDVNGAETKLLTEAMNSSHAVIIRGLHTFTIPVGKRPAEQTCLREDTALDLPIPPEHSGLLRLDSDTRRVPLGWMAFPNGGTRGKWRESFALVTARAADKDAIDTIRLKRALASGYQPYSTMITIPTFSAIEILCGRTATKGVDWQSCMTTEAWDEMNGATVIIGDHIGEADMHPTIQGFVYGADLQANYVASLLDQRYYLPLLSRSQNDIAIVVFFLGLQILFWRCRSLLAALIYAMALWGGIFIASVGILAFTGYLLTLWVQGINFVTILVSFLEHWAAKLCATPHIATGATIS